MRDLKAAQIIVRDLLEDDEATPLAFVNSSTIFERSDFLASEIVASLNFDLDFFRKPRPIRDAFEYLRSCIESTGVFVLLMSDLGNYHSRIPVDVFRGIALSDKYAPFIVINNQDARVAWSFTALHEVTHLWLGSSGVSGAWGELEIERFCNRVAGHILLPKHELYEISHLDRDSFESAVETIIEFAE